MAECRLTPAAERDLEKIWSYTLKHWGLAQASRYTDVLTRAFSELAQYPPYRASMRSYPAWLSPPQR